jgi:hypothetical protein
MIWLKLWNMLLIIQMQNTVQTAKSIYLLILSVVLAAIRDSVLGLRKDYPQKRTFIKYFCIISHYDTLKDDLLTLDEVIVGRIFHT